MAYPSINTWLPDPFTVNWQNLAPLSGVIHTPVGQVLTGSTNIPTRGTLGTQLFAGQFTAPIVVSNTTFTGATGTRLGDAVTPNTYAAWTGPYWRCPSANDIISVWGGTDTNTAIANLGNIPSFIPLRQNNSNTQVRTGDVFGVPVINLSTFPQIFAAGANGRATGLSSTGTYVVIPGYGSKSFGGPNTSTNYIPSGPLSKTAASQLTFQITSVPNGTNTTGSYLLF